MATKPMPTIRTRPELRKTLVDLTDTKPVHAVAGAVDLAVATVRDLPATIDGLRKDITVELDATRVRARVEETYGDLAKRGELLTRRIAREPEVKAARKQATATSSKAKAARTTARKSTASTRRAVKATRTSATRTARKATAATAAAAETVGQ